MNVFFKSIITLTLTFSIFFTAENVQAAPKITLQRAQEIATSHAKVPLKDVSFIESSLDTNFMRSEYEIEFFYNNIEYDYEIDANSGKVTSFSQEKHGAYAQPNRNATYISKEQAKQIAFKHANVSPSILSMTEFDIDDGIAVYEIEFFANNSKYEYEINAISSEVIKFEKE